MNGKQNIVFFLGIILIVMVFWIHGYWTILKDGITGAIPGGGAKVPGPGGIPQLHGGCPGPNYYKHNGKCYPSSVNLPGQTNGGLV